MENIGKSIPWSGDWQCGRKECKPCEGRLELASEKERETLIIAGGEKVKKKDLELRKALPSCTAEGVN